MSTFIAKQIVESMRKLLLQTIVCNHLNSRSHVLTRSVRSLQSIHNIILCVARSFLSSPNFSQCPICIVHALFPLEVSFSTCANIAVPDVSVMTHTRVRTDDVHAFAVVTTHHWSATLVNVNTTSCRAFFVARPTIASG